MKTRSPVPMRVAKIGSVIMSAVFCVIGILFITHPALSARVFGAVLGTSMVAFGLVKLAGYFSRDLYRLAFQYDWVFGVLLAILGVIVLLRPADTLSSFFLAMGIATIADSLFKARTAFDARRFGIRAWWAILTLSVATAAVGLLLVFRPWASAQALMVLMGLALLSQGLLDLCVTVSTVKIIRHQYPDIIDVDYVNNEESDMQ